MKEKVKQVIVIRKDLSMRRGKMIAQGAHASLAALIDLGTKSFDNSKPQDELNIPLVPEIEQWLNTGQTKIVVSVDSEQQLLDIYEKAQNAHLPRSIVKDLGLTEFDGNSTYTAVAIGPAWSSNIDAITQELPLL